LVNSPSAVKYCRNEGEADYRGFQEKVEFEWLFLAGGDNPFCEDGVDHCNQKGDAGSSEDVGNLYDGDILILAVREEAPEETAEEEASEAFGADEEDGDSQTKGYFFYSAVAQGEGEYGPKEGCV